LLEAMIGFMDFQAVRWLIDGVVPGQAGNDHPTIFPMGTFKTKDGYVNVAAMLGWERFLAAIDGEELKDDPRFVDAVSRARNREPLREAVEARLAARSSEEWIAILTAADLPCGPVLSLDEVFADPQVRHLQLTRRVEHAEDGELELLRLPLTFSETPASVRGAAPVPGSQTREILAEHGFDEASIEELIASGAVATQRRRSGW
jgi:formyl-CoA transferase